MAIRTVTLYIGIALLTCYATTATLIGTFTRETSK